jgi:phage regulator Rha-like protein
MAKKSNPRKKTAVASQPIEPLIHVVRGQRVMFDAELARLYEVPTRALNQAVRRNIERFPEDFAFQLSNTELENWRSQFVTSNPSAKMGLRRPPLVFTQEGVAMLSAVLRSDRAVHMSIAIVRTFVRMRKLMATNKDIAARVEKLESGHERTASVIEVLVDDIDRLAREVKDMKTLPAKKRRIGFIIDQD